MEQVISESLQARYTAQAMEQMLAAAQLPSGGAYTSVGNSDHGEIWRLVTPIFVHYGPVQVIFNMWALVALGTILEYRRGTRTMAILVLVSAIASNMGQFACNVFVFREIIPFGGMSGVVYALFGYVWMKGKVDPEHGMALHPRTVQFMLLWLVVCFTGLAGPIANAAHVIGLLAGIALGLARL